MANINRKMKHTPDVKSGEQYEELLDELLRESGAQISQRNQEHFDETLKLFLQAGCGQIEHSDWRNVEMISTMFEILTAKHRRLNPWKYEEYRYEDDAVFDPEPQIQQKEIYPGIDRFALEVLAADQHIKNGQRTKSQRVTKNPENDNSKKVKERLAKTRKGNLPELRVEDIAKGGLSGKQVVEDWARKNPGKIDKESGDFMANLELSLSRATSRTKINLAKQGPVSFPMRCHKSNRGKWGRYALIKEGSAGGKDTGNTYGIIKTDTEKEIA
ncbi:hypothetical protein KBY58_05305 [Cyanobium sp. HWJ4-Hawea]|uniref:hypothetical protein n=1 Tax=Cyanobium sp. HWJ4-Hawea TaxID=2823713 RepID=UPI0020CDD837|nr:hypothetical protein [Cyanobium sp. HWJ4-Hawea]MCP9808844.1 hypothetical protein [Cyanobium sp. HWJ4-Hawea]